MPAAEGEGEGRGEPAICAAHTAAAAGTNETVWTDFFVTAALKRRRGAVGIPFETGEAGNNATRQELKERILSPHGKFA